MSTHAIIGKVFVFQVLFADSLNTPIAVNTPRISIFYFDRTTGSKTLLVDSAVLPAAVPAEVGRYAYSYTVPGSFDHGDVLYAEMSGTDPNAGDTLILVDQTLNLISSSSGTGGLRTTFVKGG